MEDKQIQEQTEEQYSVLFNYLGGLIGPAISFLIYFLTGGTFEALILISFFGAGYLCFMHLRLGPCPLTTIMSSFLTLFWVMALTQSTGNEEGFAIIFFAGIIVLSLSLFYSLLEDEERYMFLNYFLSLIVFSLVYHFGRSYI